MSVLKVTERYLSKIAETIGDPKEFLSQFEDQLRVLEIPVRDIEKAKEVIEAMNVPRDPSAPRIRSMEEAYPGFGAASDLAYSAYFKVTVGGARLAEIGHKLFLSIIQTLTLPPPLRKKIEMASRAYLRPPKPRMKEHGNARYLERFSVYEKFMAVTHSHLEVARQAIEKGKGHIEEGEGATKVRVGDFTLVNTGGFSEKVMDEVSEVVQKAQALLKSSGLGKVCYGDIQVTNTIHKSKVLAFYLFASDELFIRANVKATVDSVQTVLHELGHRMEHKFLSSKQRDLDRLYFVIGSQERSRKLDDKLKERKPQPGEELKSKGKTYKVRQTVYDRGGYKVLLDSVDRPGVTAHVGLETYLELKGEKTRDFDTNPDYKGFVTDYAGKSPSENFAEMFAFYCMGRLPALQNGLFEELLFGTSSTAHERAVIRVASRWILEG
jgi:hypothetical protein